MILPVTTITLIMTTITLAIVTDDTIISGRIIFGLASVSWRRGSSTSGLSC